jgi:hypothetical protein
MYANWCRSHDIKTTRPWQQDSQGRVWRQGSNSITRQFLTAPFRHSEYGPMVSIAERTNGTIPEDAVPFTIEVVS